MEGSIYRIFSPSTDKCYVGSTTKPINSRLCDHKSSYKGWKDSGKNHYTTSFEILQYDDVCIELLEFVQCESIQELLNTPNTVNKQMSKTEEEFKEAIKLQNKTQYEKHKNERVQYQKQYYEENKDKVLEYSKTRYDRIKERQCARQGEKIVCSCGMEITRGSKARHEKSERHRNKISQQ